MVAVLRVRRCTVNVVAQTSAVFIALQLKSQWLIYLTYARFPFFLLVRSATRPPLPV